MKENSKQINESRGFDGSSREIVTYKCIECGKKRTAMRKSFNKSEEEYICRDCFSKNQANLPERIEMLIKRNKGMSLNPAWVKNHKLAMEKLSKDSTWIENNKVATLKSHGSEAWAINHKIGIERRSQNPDFIKNLHVGIIKRSQNPQWSINVKIAGKKLINNPSWKAYIESRPENTMYKESLLIGVTGQGFWYGHPILHDDKMIYCELWRDVNKRVHAFFDNKCCVCGAPETTRSHVGHHVFYVKNACCWKSEDGIYYTNLNVKTHSQNDYCIGENPNYFVILCQSCHGKTNGTFENRKMWADYFKNMIDEKYNGKCYLTKEEYQEYKLNK
jgi:hypothetical protein